MKLAKLLFITAVALALLMTYVNATPVEEEEAHDEKELSTALDSASISTTDVPSSQSEEEPHSLGGLGRFLLAKNKTEHVKCNKDPKICLAKGSSGPYCCKKKCVNLETDRLNCGHCSKKCKYNETCCKGKCVNLARDKNHCGRCNNSCGSGDFCMYGLCNYAS